MPLYFPRNKEEEDFALNQLPDDIGEMKSSACFVCVVVWSGVVFSWEEHFKLNVNQSWLCWLMFNLSHSDNNNNNNNNNF